MKQTPRTRSALRLLLIQWLSGTAPVSRFRNIGSGVRPTEFRPNPTFATRGCWTTQAQLPPDKEGRLGLGLRDLPII